MYNKRITKINEIPKSIHLSDNFVLEWLNTAVVLEDFEVVKLNEDFINTQMPEHMEWPRNLDFHNNLIDLAWHEREFTNGTSLAYVLRNQERSYLGCLYVYPIEPGVSAYMLFWVTKQVSTTKRNSLEEVIRQRLESLLRLSISREGVRLAGFDLV